MKKVSESKMAAKFSDYVNVSQDHPIVVMRGGKPIAVLVAVSSESQARQIAAKPVRTMRAIFQKASEQLDRGEGIPLERFRRELEEMRPTQNSEPPKGKSQRKSKRRPAAKSG